MTKAEKQRQLKELEMIDQGKEVIRFQSPRLEEIEALRENCEVRNG